MMHAHGLLVTPDVGKTHRLAVCLLDAIGLLGITLSRPRVESIRGMMQRRHLNGPRHMGFSVMVSALALVEDVFSGSLVQKAQIGKSAA